MIQFYLVTDDHQVTMITPEQHLARQMGNPPFPVKNIGGRQTIRELMCHHKDKRIGLIFDPEFWYSPFCWMEWIRHVEEDASDMEVHVPLGGQNPSWRNGLNIPLYGTLRQLEHTSGFCGTELWKIANAEQTDDFAVLVVGIRHIERIPINLTLMDLPSYWVKTRQPIRIFCKGWLHPFSAVRDEGRRDDLVGMCDWKGMVLELGCGAGLMAKNCRDRGFDLTWVGLDIDRSALQKAATHVDVAVQADINRNLPFDSTCRFDRIVCGDVLEHLPYPWEFLSRIHSHVKPDGLLIASFPNIGHWSVIEDLLAGRWDETPSGIFCVSHLRFGTKGTWQRWFHQSGWRILRWESELLPIPETWNGDLMKILPVSPHISELETIRYRIVVSPESG